MIFDNQHGLNFKLANENSSWNDDTNDIEASTLM
jgi:hypothetical protein